MPDETPDWAPATDTATATVDSDIPDWAPTSDAQFIPDWAPKDEGSPSTPETDKALKFSDIAKTAGQAALETAKGFIPKSVEQVASMATPVVGAVEDVGKTYGAIKDWISGKPIDQIVKQRYPETQILAEAEKTPAFSKERFQAGFNVLAQMGMAAGLVRGLPKGGEIDASRITSTEGVPQREVRTQVGEETPLRQQGETTGAQVEGSPGREPVSTGAPVALTAQAADAPRVSTYDVIVSSAIKKPNGEIVTGVNHPDARIKTAGGYDAGVVDGFVTKSGVFLDRQQALDHAIATKQIPKSVAEKISKGRDPTLDDIDLEVYDPAYRLSKGLEQSTFRELQQNEIQKATEGRESISTTAGREVQPIPRSSTGGGEHVGQVPSMRTTESSESVLVRKNAGVEQPAPAPTPVESDVKYTGVANRVYDRLTEEGQLGEVPTGAGRSTADSIAIGRRRIQEGANPDEIASRFWKTRRISDTEFAVLRAHSENLHGMSLAAEKEMKANPTPENTAAYEQAFQAFHDFSRNVVQPAKTATSNIFRAMQDEEPIHVDSYTGLRQAMLEKNGRDIKPEERPVFEKAADEVQAATRERNGEAAKVDTALKKAAPKSKKLTTTDDVRGHIADLMKRRFPCA